jgi:mono/diheme cytochrome c family protein
MRNLAWVLVLTAFSGAFGARAEAPAPLGAIVETIKRLEADPAAQETFRNDLEAYEKQLKSELDEAAASLDALKASLGANEANLKVAEERIAAMERAAAALQALAGAPAAAPVDHAAEEAFETKIRPILAERCYSCHGPEKQKGNLRLDSRAAMLQGGETGPAIAPGNVAGSALLHAMAYNNNPKMPPAGKLPQAEIDALTEWIQAGAQWPAYDAGPQAAAPVKAAEGIDVEKGRQWWAFKPVTAHAPPATRDTAWSKTGIDPFLLARMEAEGLAPAAPADKRTLIRRVTFDLTGLPPTPEEVDAFLQDAAPEAYAKVVERLLASPAYGERWARHWLDVMRYTDSFDSRGSATTDPTEIYKYRDWVVRAFNDDMPFDRFVRYQIAGDILSAQAPVFDPKARLPPARSPSATGRRATRTSKRWSLISSTIRLT